MLSRVPSCNVLVLIGFLTLVSTASIHLDGAGDRISSPVARVVPSVVLRADSPMEVSMLFENTSDKPIRYEPDTDGRSLTRLRYTLMKDGVVIERRLSTGDALFNEKAIPELPPGGTLVHRLNLRNVYGRLKPGRYALEAHVTGVPKAYDLTPIRFRERILYLDVVGE